MWHLENILYHLVVHFDHRGELEVLNRKYDALLVEVYLWKTQWD